MKIKKTGFKPDENILSYDVDPALLKLYKESDLNTQKQILLLLKLNYNLRRTDPKLVYAILYHPAANGLRKLHRKVKRSVPLRQNIKNIIETFIKEAKSEVKHADVRELFAKKILAFADAEKRRMLLSLRKEEEFRFSFLLLELYKSLEKLYGSETADIFLEIFRELHQMPEHHTYKYFGKKIYWDMSSINSAEQAFNEILGKDQTEN